MFGPLNVKLNSSISALKISLELTLEWRTRDKSYLICFFAGSVYLRGDNCML